MTLPASGPLSMSQIATEFGGAAPHSLSEYYGADSGVPSSGPISFSNFYGKSSLFTLNITTNQVGLNIRSALIAAGWNQTSAAKVNITAPYINRLTCGNTAYPGGLHISIGSGTFVGSDDASTAAFSTQAVITVTNAGTIAGAGGFGGKGQTFYYGSSPVQYVEGGSGGGGQRFATNTTSILNASDGAFGQIANFDGFHTATGGKGGAGGSWGVGGSSGQNGVDNSGGIINGSFPAQSGTLSGYAVFGNVNITWISIGTRMGRIG